MMNKIKDLIYKLMWWRKSHKEDLSQDKTLDFEISQEEPKAKFFDFISLQNIKTKFQTFVSKINYRRLKKMEIDKGEVKANIKAKTQLFKLPKEAPFSFDKLSKILDVEARPKLNALYVFLFFILGSFISGKILALLLTPSSTKEVIQLTSIDLDFSRDLTNRSIQTMRESKIFKTETIKKDDIKKPIQTQEKCRVATKPSKLPLKLLNATVLQDSVKSIASVQVRNLSDAQNFREGDKIEELAQIDKIDRFSLIIKNLKDGQCEIIETKNNKERTSPISVLSPRESATFRASKPKIAGIENNGNQFTVEKNFMREKMKDLSSILTQARGIQMTNPDGSLAFKVVDVEPGGIFSYLGIQDNDIITGINGQPITDLNQVMNLFGKITELDSLNLTIRRDGSEETQDYKFQ